MQSRCVLLLAVVSVAGCEVALKNGLFACGQPSDCPSGYYCWASDNRCYDTKEPECEPKTCDQVISEFASLGIAIECGSLPDGCDHSIECGSCPEGTVCGANGQSFSCGCEENTCATFGNGAECGLIPTRCGGGETTIFCGSCLGDGLECVDNQCVCPSGNNCDDACGGQCGTGETCVQGECCTPTYPCAKNDCSPPEGLPNGCGGVAHCPSCPDDSECILGNELRYECLGDCTCEANGTECGSDVICGSPAFCGSCADNGFDDGFHCKDGRCVCEDQYEDNDSLDTAELVCGEGAAGVNCIQEAWRVDLQATFHGSSDWDFYVLRVLDMTTPIIAQTYNSRSEPLLYMAYLCPDGYPGMVGCSDHIDSVQGLEFCETNEDTIGIQRSCGKSVSGEVGTLVVGVRPEDFRSDCDGYELKIVATYGQELPTY